MSKLMMLVAAKWREFSRVNPYVQTEERSQEQQQQQTQEYSKPSRTRVSKEVHIRCFICYLLETVLMIQ